VPNALRTMFRLAIVVTALSAPPHAFAGNADLVHAVAPTRTGVMRTVNSTADSNDGNCDVANCTLREAVIAAQGGDVIDFSSLFNTPQTISLLTELPLIQGSITIQGAGAHLLTVRRDPAAMTNFRVFTTGGGSFVIVTINGMTITGGVVGAGESGGGINAFTQLVLNQVHVTGNTAGVGGGVQVAFANGEFTNCTFSNNTSSNADASGGGIFFLANTGNILSVVNSTISGNHAGTAAGISHFSVGAGTTLEIVNSTIVNNTAGAAAGGIRTFTQDNGSATTTLRNTIVAGNSPTNLTTATLNGAPTAVQTLGFNLSNDYNAVFVLQASDITANALLGPLQDNLGRTPTHAPLFGSPALDGGNSSGSSTDQRGFLRPRDLPGIPNASGGDGGDIGAFEAQTAPAFDALLLDGFEGPA